MIFAAEHGRVGERYIISDRFMGYKEINEIAAEAAGVRPPHIKVPLPLLDAAAHGNDLARQAPEARPDVRRGRAADRDHDDSLDHSKAERELGWKPGPVEELIRRAAIFFNQQRAGK